MVDSLTLSKPQVYETRTIQLSSPMLHIGSSVSQLNPFEYVQTARKVYLPNPEILAKTLQQRGKLQDFINTIENKGEIADLLRQTFGNDWQTATDSEGNPIFPESFVDGKWTAEKITDLRPMIRNGFGQLYIPGSSIKGAIRTAIAYYLVKHAEQYQVPHSQHLSEIEKRLRQKLDKGELKSKYQQKFADDDILMNHLFSRFSLNYQGRNILAKTGPNTDIMRAVQVSDSQPLLKKTVTRKATGKKVTYNIPVVAEAIVSSHFKDWNAKYRASIYAEMVRNVRTEFTISVDSEMLSWFQHEHRMQLPFQSVDDLVKICQEFAQEQWDGEHDYWHTVNDNQHSGKELYFSEIRKFYDPEKCAFQLRLGWGTGMNGTTIGWLFNDELRADLRDTCVIAAPNFEAPKSRRTIVDPKGEIKFVPGWVRLRG